MGLYKNAAISAVFIILAGLVYIWAANIIILAKHLDAVRIGSGEYVVGADGESEFQWKVPANE